MSDEYVQLTNGQKLYPGAIIIVEKWPDIRWILHRGNYTYDEKDYYGWFLCTVDDHSITPLVAEDLIGCTVVDYGDNDKNNIKPTPYEPTKPECNCDKCDKTKEPAIISKQYKALLDSAFISVPNITKRDQINTETIPDGKICRVNSVNGAPHYYVWSVYSDKWLDWNIVDDFNLDDNSQALINKYNETIQAQLSQMEEDEQKDKKELSDKHNEDQTLIENKVADIDSKYDKAITDLQEQIKSKDESYLEEISKLKARVETLETQLEKLSAYDFDDMQKKIEDHGKAIEDLKAAVAATTKSVTDAVNTTNAKFNNIADDQSVVLSNDKNIRSSNVVISNSPLEDSRHASTNKIPTEKAIVDALGEAESTWDTVED